MGRNLHAIMLMVVSMLCFSAMEAMAKGLVATYPVVPLLAIRSGMVVALLIIYGLYMDGFKAFHTARPGIHLIRMVACFASPYFFLLALKEIPLADATVIYFSGAFFITALSKPILKEPVDMHRSLATVCGFIGVIIVIQPNFNAIEMGSLYALLTALFHALAILLGRLVSDTENTFKLVFSGNLGLLLGAAILLPWHWAPAAPSNLGYIFILTMLGLAAHCLIIYSFSKAPVGTVAPFEYTGVIWAAGLGYFFFQEIPTLNVIFGALIVTLSGIYVIFCENRAISRRFPSFSRRLKSSAN